MSNEANAKMVKAMRYRRKDDFVRGLAEMCDCNELFGNDIYDLQYVYQPDKNGDAVWERVDVIFYDCDSDEPGITIHVAVTGSDCRRMFDEIESAIKYYRAHGEYV